MKCASLKIAILQQNYQGEILNSGKSQNRTSGFWAISLVRFARLPAVTSLFAICPKAMPSLPDESVVTDPYNLSLRVGTLKVTEALPSSSCFTLGIPSGHSAGSHSTTWAIFSTRRFPAAIGVGSAFKQAKRPVRRSRAEQVKYARLQHRL